MKKIVLLFCFFFLVSCTDKHITEVRDNLDDAVKNVSVTVENTTDFVKKTGENIKNTVDTVEKVYNNTKNTIESGNKQISETIDKAENIVNNGVKVFTGVLENSSKRVEEKKLKE